MTQAATKPRRFSWNPFRRRTPAQEGPTTTTPVNGALSHRIATTHLARPHIVAVFTSKGGVGKTTTSACLGIFTARLRGKTLLVEINPDGGSLGVRMKRTTGSTILELRDKLARRQLASSEFEAFINHSEHGFDALLMPPGQKPPKPLSGEDFRAIMNLAVRRGGYETIIVDCGTNLSASVMAGVIPLADQLVVVSSTILDEANVTYGGLMALSKAGKADMVRNAITLLIEKTNVTATNVTGPTGGTIAESREQREKNAAKVRAVFEQTTRKVIPVHYDAHLGVGDIINPNKLSPQTQESFLALAAEVVESLARKEREG